MDRDLARLRVPRRPIRPPVPRPLGARRLPRPLRAGARRGRRGVRARGHHRGSSLLGAARARAGTRGGVGAANPPSAALAWPPAAGDGLRTYPPRENGGNMDIRDLGPGARLWLPVHVPGALLSVGDLHFAQGDGEVCISALETGGSATFRVGLRRGGWRPTFPCYEAPPRPPRAVSPRRASRSTTPASRAISTSTSRPAVPWSSCSAGSPPSAASTARRPMC
ncbi:MAG: acetamidase/formamidase family protein [Thermoleophilaceae bacterium]|nr:acetamidase/formamidase family protein [Thermoleophilaceae bacterium]